MLQESVAPQVLESPTDRDAEIYQVLLNKVESRLRTVDEDFEKHGLTSATTSMSSTRVVTNEYRNTVIEVTSAVILPFDVDAIAPTIWEVLSSERLRSDQVSR